MKAHHIIYVLSVFICPLHAGLNNMIVNVHYDQKAPSFNLPLHTGVATGCAKATYEILHTINRKHQSFTHIQRMSRILLGAPGYACIGFGVACLGYYPTGTYLYKKYLK